MKVIATYNLKGGVGKTAAAVNLAWLAASEGRRTLLWDLDAQGAASFYLRARPRLKGGAGALIERRRNLRRAVRDTEYDNLDLVPANADYRNFDLDLSDLKKPTERLKKLLREVRDDYDIVFLDCAPSMSVLSENILDMSDILLLPLIPTHLSVRAYDQVSRFCRKTGTSAALVPYFSMVDRRKKLHREVVSEFAAAHPDVLRSYIPYASQVEQMGSHRAPVNVYADGSAGGRAFRALWEALRGRLGKSFARRD